MIYGERDDDWDGYDYGDDACDCRPTTVQRPAYWYFTKTGVVWQSNAGPVDVGRMGDQHLANTLALLERRAQAMDAIYPSGSPDRKVIAAMKAECKRRFDLRRLYSVVMADKHVPLKQALEGIMDEHAEVVVRMRSGGRLPEPGESYADTRRA